LVRTPVELKTTNRLKDGLKSRGSLSVSRVASAVQ
jgi:hypothetical protein